MYFVIYTHLNELKHYQNIMAMVLKNEMLVNQNFLSATRGETMRDWTLTFPLLSLSTPNGNTLMLSKITHSLMLSLSRQEHFLLGFFKIMNEKKCYVHHKTCVTGFIKKQMSQLSTCCFRLEVTRTSFVRHVTIFLLSLRQKSPKP